LPLPFSILYHQPAAEMTMTMMIPHAQNKSFRRLSIIRIILLLLHGNRIEKSRAFLAVPTFLTARQRLLATTTTASSSPFASSSRPSWSSPSVAPHRTTVDRYYARRRRPLVVVHAAVPRYGPGSSSLDRTGDSDDKKDDDSSTAVRSPSAQTRLSDQDQTNFKRLVQQVMSVRDVQHIPSLLTQNMELLFAVIGASGGKEGVALVQDILNDFPENDMGDDDANNNNDATIASRRQVEETIDLMLSFAQDFVDQASELDNQNKRLLGKIIKVISPSGDASNNNNGNNNNNNNTPKTAWEREEALDKLLEQERAFLTAGFLRHLGGECERIANAPTMTRESSRLLEVLSMIQTRVLEEMAMTMDQGDENNKLGEAALVLGQLIGYESKAERLAVLEAGLLVRNNNGSVEFAQQMRDLTLEALDGFNRVVGGADPGLVQIIQEIDARLEEFLLASIKQDIDGTKNKKKTS
jgi:hypothetical protein